MTLHDARRAFHLLGEVVELRDDPPAAKRHLLASVCKFVGARQGSVIELGAWHPSGDLTLRGVTHGGWASTEALHLWEQAMLLNQPRLDTIIDRATRIRGVVQTRLREQIIPDEVWRKTPDCNVMAKLAGVSHQLCGWFHRGGGEVCGFTFHRMWGDAVFGMRERNRMHLVNVELYRLFRAGRFDADPGAGQPELSPRQREVLEGLLKGDSVKQVALRVGVTFRTAEGYVKALYRRFGVHSRGELFARLRGGGPPSSSASTAGPRGPKRIPPA